MRKLLILSVVVAALAAAPAAHAVKYVGKASDGTKVTVRTNAQGKPDRVDFGRYKARCTRGYGSVVNPIKGFIPPFTAVSTERLVDRGKFPLLRRVLRDGTKVRVRADWEFEADHTVEDHWQGRYRTKGVYRRHGHTLTRCATHFRFDLARQ